MTQTITLQPDRGSLSLNAGGITLRGLRFGIDLSRGVHGDIETLSYDSYHVEERTADSGLLSRREYVLTAEKCGIRTRLYIGETAAGGMIHLGADVLNMSGGDINLWNINMLGADGARGQVFGLPEAAENMSFYAYGSAGVHSFPSKREAENAFLRRLWGSFKVTWHRHFDMVYEQPDWYVTLDLGGIFGSGSGNGLFAGFYGPGNAFGDFCAKMTDEAEGFRIRSRMDGVLLADGELRTGENAVIMQGGAVDCSKIWAQLCVLQFGARRKFGPLSGYCSWYRTYSRVNEAEIDAAIEQYGKLPIKTDLIQIDDGFEITPGDWDANEKFPSGMGGVAAKIAQAGFMPGVWIAPSAVHVNSTVYKAHPDWIQRLENGDHAVSFSNWSGGQTVYIDPSNPECIGYMKDLVHKIVDEWGYKYIKFDFTYGLALGLDLHDPRLTSFQMSRNMYKAFREAAGDDIYILACVGVPARYALGLADAARIGPDCGTSWSGGTEDAMFCAIIRSNINRLWWWNDPDVYYLRDESCKLSWDEKKFFATVTAMTGGLTLSSDLPDAWSQDAVDKIFTKIVPPAGEPFYPVGFSAGMPSVLCVNRESDAGTIAIAAALHWDKGGDVELRFGELGLVRGKPYHVYDFWNNKYAGKFEDRYTCKRGEPHSADLFVIRPAEAGRPGLIGDTTHVITQVKAANAAGKLDISWTCHAGSSRETFLLYCETEPKIEAAENCAVIATEKQDGPVWRVLTEARRGNCRFAVAGS